MDQFWQDLIKSLGIFAVLAGALTWLAKSVITHFLDKDVEKYKNSLATEAARELEQFKSQLHIASKEHDVRFSKLHEKRAEIIAELHSRMYKAFLSVKELELGIKDGYDDEATLKQSSEIAYEACSHAFSFFKKNKYYLSKEHSDLIHGILSTMELTSSSYEYSGSIRTKALDHWDKQSEQIGLIVSRVEQDFRIMLGSEREENVGLEKREDRNELSK